MDTYLGDLYAFTPLIGIIFIIIWLLWPDRSAHH